MMPRLGAKYPIDIEVISRPKAEYQTDEYFELDLPVAPAVMVAEEIVVEGANITEHEVETCICRHLDLPEPEPPKKGILSRLLKK
ncbi:MAG: hypothetical protein WBN77_17620 [Desulfobacterales bacterium]|uniref:Uncharacterized protein n=1 Tax=uncultured Desulfobacterium sp. TaxID=201089 RepID=E1YJ67_9BACT|nr:hypothetical protein N47_E48330 [uncultured Desulfobacterium sp.]